ncbi:MAG TPA: recombination protein O N-terminal domain-containing protein [Candidatus Paceibacterota bacterium]|nr:recombination protein O N-terminal domain-containing protein [Candidatus Paceibacterota bacterium]
MYQKYQTEAIVLSAYERGEADKSFALFTSEFGLVRARASAVRTERSKMRHALQLYTRGTVALVRGKSGWRLAGASATTSAMGKSSEGIAAFARVANLTLRLVAGEERNEYLFSALAQAHEALMKENVETAPMIEIVAVARVLYALGYISNEALKTALFTHTMYAPAHLDEAANLREELLASINRALSQTHL